MNILQDSLRYRLVRSLSPKEFEDIVFKVLNNHPVESDYEAVFDILVDRLIEERKQEP